VYDDDGGGDNDGSRGKRGDESEACRPRMTRLDVRLPTLLLLVPPVIGLLSDDVRRTGGGGRGGARLAATDVLWPESASTGDPPPTAGDGLPWPRVRLGLLDFHLLPALLPPPKLPSRPSPCPALAGLASPRSLVGDDDRITSIRRVRSGARTASRRASSAAASERWTSSVVLNALEKLAVSDPEGSAGRVVSDGIS
jgi:hypothetical protein